MKQKPDSRRCGLNNKRRIYAACLSLFFFFSTNGARRDRHRYRYYLRSFHPRFGDNDFPCSAGARARDREISFANFIFAMPLLFAYLLRPSALSFVRVAVERSRRSVGFHRDTMMNAATSASRRETAWFVAAPYMAYITGIARKLGFTRFRVYVVALGALSLSLSPPLPFLSARRERENAGFIRAPFRAIFFP